jgi:glycolate oxidase iron-sulfur subunit
MKRSGDFLGAALAEHADRLSNCVHCGFCVPACPTWVRLGDEADSPRGRLHLMGAVVEGRLSPASDAFQRHLDRCLGCRACESVCPSGVEYGFLLERAREVAVAARPPSLLQRLLLAAIRSPFLFRPWMWSSRLLRASGIPALLARGAGRAPDAAGASRIRLASAMLAASAPPDLSGVDAPDVSIRSRVGAPAGEAPAPTAADAAQPPPGRAALLTGCVQHHLFRRVNEATRRVLEANGWDVVEVSGQGCCGALHAHGGRLDDAREMARRNVRAFRRAGVDRIVANAAGCGAAMGEYAELLAADGDAEDARWFAERVRDVSVILAGERREIRRGGGLPLRIAYDPPCHLLHGQRVSDPPVRMLEAIPGAEVLVLEGGEECCGGAGIYGITHPDLGGRIGRDKVEAIRRTGATVVATGNPGCIMQIGAGVRMVGLPVQVVHPVELLDLSYRRGGVYGGERERGGSRPRAQPRPPSREVNR